MSGMSATTLTDMMLAAGAYVTVGGTDMGALMGTIHYWVEMERYHPDLYGAKGEIKKTGHVIKAVPKLSFTMMEWEYAKFQEIWHHLGHGSDASSERIGSDVVGKMSETDDYQEVIVLGMSLCDSKPVKIIIYNAYVSNNPDITLSDREDTQIEVELTGVYTYNAPTTFPAVILMNK